ncbi:MAG: tyrosine-protein phosphatase, partial [Lachnospiraceae bacterium]|nr:tyrosine-protein phosphatase [Lachnospiraceae bacterium]
SYKREDYPDLTDEEYANFRLVETTGMGSHLYRGSSPIQERLNRYMYIDKFLEKYKIKNIINLTDREEWQSKHKGYENSYYSKQNVLCLSLSVDMLSDRYKNGVRKALQFIIDNEPPYYVHCVEGQDRTGFFCGMLEFFMGASFEEVVTDYMKTYDNYYGIKKGDQRYPYFADDMIQVYERCFYTEPITNIDLKEASTNYFKELGFDDDALEKLRQRLK